MKKPLLLLRPAGRWPRLAPRFYLGLLLALASLLTGRRAMAQAVTTFTLLNADSGQPIAGYDPLLSGAVLNLSTLPTRHLGIRANTNPATVGSVRFGYDGNPNYQLDNTAPYVLAGTGGLPWTPAAGTHTLTATPLTPAHAPPFPLGAFAGGPNGSDAAVQARLDTHFDHLTTLMGTAPRFMNSFVDFRLPITDWPSNAGWTAWSCEQAPRFRPLIPVIGLPMATEADRGNPGPVYRAFAAGQHDAALRGVVQSWTDHGFRTLYFRPGYEMNETFMPWYVGDDAQTQADWVAAFRHIATVLRAIPGVSVKIIWNPNVRNYNGRSGQLDVTTLYPGDSYVDVVGADLYSPMHPYDLYSWARNDGTFDATFAQWAANPVNRRHYWDYPSGDRWNPTGNRTSFPFSLQDAIDLARAHGKPFSLPETGAGGDGSQGPSDDPAFPEWLAAKLAGASVAVEVVNIWDLDAGDADWTFSDVGRNGATRSLEAAAWARFFGAGVASAGTPRTVTFTVIDRPLPVQFAHAPGPNALLYPNPAPGPTALDLTDLPAGTYRVQVLDLLGRVLSEHALAGLAKHALPVQGLAAGAYVVRVQGGAVNLSLRMTRE